eukprot:12134030-Prorocentrum_lima.AAC.1
MTSSLVGSEMCIRDSLSCVRGSLSHVPVGAEAILSAAVCLCVRQLVGNPVSYTHLTLPTICSV